MSLPAAADPDPTPEREYRLRIRLPRPDRAWQAELRDLAAATDSPALVFDTPLELARHLAGATPGNGLR